MVLSILHRMTGFGLAAGAVLVTWGLLAAAGGAESFMTFHNFTASIPGKLMLLGWAWSFSFHFLNGIRHLVWDTGRGLTIRQAANSAWFVLIGSVAVTLLIWCLAGGEVQ